MQSRSSIPEETPDFHILSKVHMLDANFSVDDFDETDLYNASLQGNWDFVINLYKNNSRTHTTRLRYANGHTALHLAVLEAGDKEVQGLMDTIPKDDLPKIVNNNNSTPLHLAASRGLLQKCRYIAPLAGCWLSHRNKDTETPLFLAALHGHQDVFLYLHSVCHDLSLCTRTSDGNTVLHVTIDREYFGLAYSIMHIYEDLVGKNNSDGASPLQILATKPSAFRSSTHLQLWKSIIYHTVAIDPLIFVPKTEFKDPDTETVETPNLPGNYATCVDFFVMAKHIIKKFCKREAYQVQAGNRDLESQVKALRSKYTFPRNYATCLDFLSGSFMYILGQSGFGDEFMRIKEAKERHMWSFLIMEKLLKRNVTSSTTGGGDQPYSSVFQADEETLASDGLVRPFNLDKLPSEIKREGTEKTEDKQPSTNKTTSDSSVLIAVRNGLVELIDKILEGEKKGKQSSTSKTTWDSPILIAAKNGVSELVDKILEITPVAVHDLTADKKNVLLVAVENRNPKIFQKFLEKKDLFERLVQIVDNNGNTVLHYAARSSGRQPWRIPGAALQMQWEIKWYEYVKGKVPVHFVYRANNLGKSPAAIFKEDHKRLVTDGGKWLKSTASSCSVVAALIATVAFATVGQVPGGNKESGQPNLEGQPAFNLFAIASLVSLCFSVTALIMFLAILTSRYQTRDFRRDLPVKLFLGLSSLMVSIASVLVSFCAGHFFEVKDRFGHAVFPIYFVTCLPITFYAVAQFPLYIDVWKAIHIDIPQPSRAVEDF